MIIAFFAIGLGSTVAILSVFVINYASKKPANGELQRLDGITKTLKEHSELAQSLILRCTTIRHVTIR